MLNSLQFFRLSREQLVLSVSAEVWYRAPTAWRRGKVAFRRAGWVSDVTQRSPQETGQSPFPLLFPVVLVGCFASLLTKRKQIPQ